MREHLAMFEEALPCNPLPFLLKITELVRKNGTDFIKSDQARALLWVILAQSYGQIAIIDLCNEWDRLKNVLIP